MGLNFLMMCTFKGPIIDACYAIIRERQTRNLLDKAELF